MIFANDETEEFIFTPIQKLNKSTFKKKRKEHQQKLFAARWSGGVQAVCTPPLPAVFSLLVITSHANADRKNKFSRVNLHGHGYS